MGHLRLRAVTIDYQPSTINQPISDPLGPYDYHLPESLIAQRPAERRDASRLLVLDRASGRIEDRRFSDLPGYLRAGDLLVVNDARVIPARLVGARVPGGGRAELFLVAPAGATSEGAVWDVLARPGRRLRAGSRIEFEQGLSAEVLVLLDEGRRRVRFEAPPGQDVAALMDKVGRVPLPPYIRRPEPDQEDRVRYQTVYARKPGAVAAPTAGLHFTDELLAQISALGVDRASVTLEVGYGTFEPVRATDLARHRVAPERVLVPEETALAVDAARQRGGRVVAVGTTSARALEAAAVGEGRIRAMAGVAELTVTPGYDFRVVDALVTNFHLPRSSLLILVATFAGLERTMAAYRHAVTEGYRFYSYGDAMLIA